MRRRDAMVCGLATLLCLGAGAARAEVRMPKVFASHMVLQREMPVSVWGWANPGETVTVEIAGARASATANARGEWKATLPAMKAGGPFTLRVRGSNALTFEDVLVGEVWVCSGQSNMEMGVRMCKDAAAEIAAANYPKVRLLMVPNRWSPAPESDMDGIWKVCSPTTIAEDGWGGFSATAYYFGRELHKKLGVPIGLIDADWGGTVIQSWTPPVGFASVPALKADFERVQLADPTTDAHKTLLDKVLADTEGWLGLARKASAERKPVPLPPAFPDELRPPHDVQNATALYNGMVHPLIPFTLRGAIWYQGEANMGEGMHYVERMKALIGGWRQLWRQPDMPFYFVQIAPFNYGGRPQTLAEFWEAVATVPATIPNTGMAVVNDIGDVADIHPTNKQDVGKRLALLALKGAYGQKEVIASGPTFKSMATEGERLRVTFDNVGANLSSRDDKPLTWFEILDAENGGFVKASAVIDGASVLLSAPGVKRPVAVRFAWSMLAEPNLMNSAGLPATAFRAGSIPRRDALTQVPEAKDYRLVYDLNLAKLGPSFAYDVDDRAKVKGPIDRIAYCLELQSDAGESQFVWASMDAFTQDLGKIGIPTLASGARFQQNVAHLNVASNVASVVTGVDLSGNIEFWPSNYGQPNGANVPGASGQVYDFGDEPSEGEGYGCLQIHNFAAKQTLLAVNNWRAGAGADLGIGNQPGGGDRNPDWTFAKNAGSFAVKRLRVLVRTK